ncbi:hypothetical protein AQ481_02665 [Acinetobacter baumannii]|nr:hypothetical protein AQ481_02665 [Acinetobacter baumannii]
MNLVVEPQCECGRVIAKFRQGSLIRVDELHTDDRSKFGNDEYVFVISHDCDITAEALKEPFIEVLRVEILNEGEQNSNLIYGKSPREIHLPILLNNTQKYLKLSQLTKDQISKRNNIHVVADESFSIGDKGIKLLHSWLSSRYKRHSFPESLAERLSKLQSKIESRCKNHTSRRYYCSLY